MKKLITLTVAAVFIAQNAPVAYAVEAATVKSVRVSADSVYVATDRPVEYKTFTMEKPPKLVLELMDARMKTLQEIPVNGTALRRVRTGQFKSSPVSVSRVVMELSQKTAYEITRKGNELIVMLGARPAAPRTPAVKDTPAEPAAVPVIAPEPAKAPETPITMTLEAAPVKPAEIAPLPQVSSRKTSFSASTKGIVDSLPHDPITLDYNEADIREVLDMMGAKANINMIYGDDVNGTLTISLSKVPFDEAFKTILNVKGLAAQQAGDNILRIASPATFMAEQKKAMLQTRVFFLNYAKAAEVKTQVDAVAVAEGRKANCNSDENNNALIVTDTPIGLDATARLIRSLDRVPKQVLIEAKLVEVSLDNSLDYGISWSAYGEKNGNYFGQGDSGNKFTMGGGNPGNQSPNQTASGDASIKTYSPPFNSANGGTGVNLPANLVYGAFRLGKVASNYMFDAVITAAAKKGKAKVLSDPKVATLNNKEANINITTQIPYTTTEVTAATPPISTTKVTYLTTGIILKVTPTINSDGRISMKINPSISQPSATITPVAGGAPGVDTRSADTNVIVKNGETIVIGGLISDTQSEAVFKVPILGDIPILGYLFKKKSMKRTRMELLIFVTPKVIED